jgi:hypothetical protein
VTGGSFSPVAALILDLATGVRQGVSGQELALIREHVAAAGFSPTMQMPADRRVVGLIPLSGDTPLRRGDPVNVGEIHYLRHVIAQREWPFGTSLSAYYASGVDLALDRRSGVLVSIVGRFGIHVAIVGRTGRSRGVSGHTWMMVEFRLQTGYWGTLLQLRKGLEHFSDISRSGKRWLRLPR